jgi:hypothetical protein
VWVVWAAALAACGKGLEGPAPAVEPATQRPLEPPIVCRDQLTTEVAIHGERFSPIPIDIPDAPKAALPDVTLTRSQALDGADIGDPDRVVYSGNPDPKTMPTNLELRSWQSQEQMTIVVHQMIDTGDGMPGMLDEGIWDAEVKNANGTLAASAGVLAVVDKPAVTALVPGIVCVAQSERSIELTGRTFLRNETSKAKLEVEGVDAPFAMDLSECGKVAHEGIDAEVCDRATVALAEGSIDAGFPALTVRNPETAACHSVEDVKLRVVPPPSIDAVDPSPVCVEDTDRALVISGADFLEIDGEPPLVEVGGEAYEVQGLGGCEDVDTQNREEVRACTSIDIGKVIAAIGPGTHDVRVENPQPAGCDNTAEAILDIYPPPTLDRLVTDEICSDQAQSVIVEGENLRDGATVTVGDVEADEVTVNDDGTRLEATFDEGFEAGVYDVTVDTGGGCEDTLKGALTVNPSPLVFFVDPPVLYNDIALEATVFTSGLAAEASRVDLVNEDGDVTEIDGFASASGKPNRIQAPIPAGLDAGVYDLRVTDRVGCAGVLSGGIAITDMLALSLTDVEPGFVSPSKATAVTVTADPAMGFVSTPRGYLNPTSGGGGATALRAVLFEDDGTITAVVPADLAPGTYDLVVVNPSGEVGLIEDAITVTANEPPVVTGVVAASLPAGASDTLTVTGSGFDTGGVEIELDCLVGGTTRVTVTGTNEAVGGSGTSATVDVDLSQGSPSDPSAGSVCLVRLTNGDGAFFEYSAFSVTNASLNLSPWSDATDMTRGRRGLGLVAGRPTETSRFLYAIGGDDGVANQPFSRGAVERTVESARVDVFGEVGTWSEQRNRLPAERTQAGVARIGRFVYLAGGHDDTGATATSYRARILDPLATPEIVDLDAVPGDGDKGLGGGLWFYRVAAVFPASDPDNPGGESLPGEVFPVQLPDREEKIILSLTWDAIPGASGYRVYRSPAADDPLSALELLAEVDAGATVSVTDEGEATTAGETPLAPGSLGVWHAVAGASRCDDPDCDLDSAREGLVMVAVRDRTEAVAATDIWYLYAFGGRDGSGTYLDTFEVATVTVTLADGTQTVDDWVAGSDTLSSPRADLGAWVMSAENSAEIRGSGSPNDVWVYIGSGRTTGNAFDRNLEAGLLGASGSLGMLQDVGSDLNGDLAGLGCGMSNDQIYTFGGQATSNGTSAELCDGVGGGCAAIPELEPGAFNALGAAATDRMFMGYTQESAFFFLAGGHDGNATLDTTEQTVQ